MNEESQSDRKWRSIEKEEHAKIGSTNRSQNVNTESLLLSKKKNENPKKEQISTL